jgi:hypothetical protein
MGNVEYHAKLEQTWKIIRGDGDPIWPDKTKHYTSMVFRPVMLSFTAKSRDGSDPEFYSASISGPRLKKNGEDGIIISEDFYWEHDLPDWAQQLVKGFLATV